MPLQSFADFKEDISHRKRQVIILALTHKCNLKCLYCYESIPHKAARDMDLETIKSKITKYMDPGNGLTEVEFDFFGGEPMLRFDLIRDSIEWFKRQNWSKPFLFFISTNGTILDDSMKSWLSAHKSFVVCGLSLDGNREAHDISRDGSYDKVMANLDFFKSNFPGQPFKMTITKQTMPFVANSVIDLEAKGLYFTANTVFEDIWTDSEDKSEYLKIYEQQLNLLVEYYLDHPELSPVGPILSWQMEYCRDEDLRRQDGSCSRFCGAGNEMKMVDVDGREYPCHRFAPWVAKRLSPPEKISNRMKIKPESCRNCRLVSICPTCGGFNWATNGDPGHRTTFHCATFKLEVIATAKIQAHRLAQLSEAEIASDTKGIMAKNKMKLDSFLSLFQNGI